MYLQNKEVPEAIKSFARSVLNKDLKEYSVEQTGEITVGMPWHEACYEYYKMFQVLPNNQLKETDFSFYRAGIEGDGVVSGKEINGTTKIPNGFLFVRVTTYPAMCRIYTSDNALKLLPKEDVSLCEEECLILYFADTLKSFARPKFEQKYYNSLLGKGYLKANKSITTAGKNVLETSYVRNILIEHSKNGKYKYNISNLYI